MDGVAAVRAADRTGAHPRYDPMTASPRAAELATAAAEAAADKLAHHIQAFDVSDRLAITDAFMLASAPNDRQVKSIVDAIEDRLRDLGAKPIRREGQQEGRWVLLDYGDIVVHVQHNEERTFYGLERLWKDCPELPLPEHVTADNGAGELDPELEFRDRRQSAAGGS
jgi:ribosome-associated protein